MDRTTSGSKLRILHTVSSLNIGGMEQFVLRIAEAQRKSGHEVTILAFASGPLEERAREAAVPVLTVTAPNKALRVLKALKAIARFSPGIIHAHNPTSLQYATLGKLACGARVVMTDHGQGLGGARTPSKREWRKTDAIVAVSEAVRARREIPSTRQKTAVIPNGVDRAHTCRSRSEVRKELGLADRFVGIMVARVDGLKGHDVVLQALAMIRDGNPRLPHGMTVLFAGDGAKRVELEGMAAKLGLGANEVRFLGYRSDAADLLAASDLFMLPSLAEGMPLSVLEAMSHRLPVIATGVGGVPEIITDGENGLIIPTENPAALAAAIHRIASDGNLREKLAEAGHKRVIDHFDFNGMVRAYEELYNRISLRS